MKKTLMMAALAATGVAIWGCRSVSQTPESCWATYGHYYSATGAVACETNLTPVVEMVQSAQAESYAGRYKSQGMVELGSFTIDDGTEIDYDTVSMLAKKLNAAAAVWSSSMSRARGQSLPNADMGIPSTDYTKARDMVSSRPDEGFAEMTAHRHVIRLYGKEKAK